MRGSGASSRRKSTNSTSTPTRSSTRTKKSNSKPDFVNGNASGTATPVSRSSRSSSVNSRKSSSKKSKKSSPKVKTKVGRGYNPNLVNYKESEYHYGSDFEETDEEEVAYDDDKESESSGGEESEDGESSELEVESDLDFDATGTEIPQSRPTTPVPFWLKTEEEEEVPELKLPKSSEDLLIEPNQVLRAVSVYEVLRHYYLLLRLSLFRFEDFCAALASEEQSNLLSEVHIALLRAIVRADERDGTQFGPMDHKDSINCTFFFMDSFTWPESMRQYLSSDQDLYSEPLGILNKYQEYPYASNDAEFIDARITLLSCLADQFLTTSAVRDDIVNEGAMSNEEHCRVCHRLGDMVVCESCSGVYHLACLDPPLYDVPEYDWQCYICQAHQVDGVMDCVDDQEKNGTKIRHQALGFDRAGNKYWFITRRIFVEEAGGAVRYYTSVPQFEELMDTLDSRYYEAELCEAIEVNRDEIERQMSITEKLTQELKLAHRKSYLELENRKSKAFYHHS